MSGIRNQATWLFSSNIFAAFLQIAQTAILARNLELRELGFLAIVNTVLAVAMILQDMGMSSFIVHRQDINRHQQSTIYWINFVLGVLAGGIVFILSWPISYFYSSPELQYLIALSSLNFMVLGSLSQYQAHYIKAKRMVTLAKIEMIAKFISFLLVVFLIYTTLLRTTAVILGVILNATVRIFLMFLFGDKDWRPLFVFDTKICLEATKYGIYQLGSQVINQLRTQIDVLIVGKVLGADSLGVYSLAKDLIMQPLKLISPVINRLALPRFAESQNSENQMKNIFLKSTSVILLLSCFIYFFIMVFSPVIVRILYGSARMEVVSILPFMLFFGALRPMGGLTGAIAQANGKTNVEFYWNVVAGSIVLLLSFSTLFYAHLWYVSLVLSLSQVIITILVHPFFIKPVVGIDFFSYIKKWLPICFIFLLIIMVFYKYNLLIWPSVFGF